EETREHCDKKGREQIGKNLWPHAKNRGSRPNTQSQRQNSCRQWTAGALVSQKERQRKNQRGQEEEARRTKRKKANVKDNRGEPFMRDPRLSRNRGGKRIGVRNSVGLQNVASRGEVPPRVDGRNRGNAKSEYAEEQDRCNPVARKSCVLRPGLTRGRVVRPLWGDVLNRSFRAGRVHSIHVHQLAYPSEKSGVKRSVVRIAGGGLHKTWVSFQVSKECCDQRATQEAIS